MKNQALPDVHVAISYDVIYNDYKTVDPASFIKDIPTLPLLHFIVRLQNEVLYAVSDYKTQRQMIKDMCPWLDVKARRKAWDFQKKQDRPLLMTCDTAFYFFRLALANYVPMESDDNELELCQDEMEGVYRAILYCNQLWTDIGWSDEDAANYKTTTDPLFMAKLSMRVDLPVVEFKLYKDFRTQFYKAMCFFKFCENDNTFKTYLPYFYADHKVKNWKEYLLRLFNFFSCSLKGQYIKFNNAIIQKADIEFFDQYTIDVNCDEVKTLWTDSKAMGYLRDHFLVQVSADTYLLLNANLLVDKMYQGMKFDFFRTIKKNKLKNPQGNKYSDYPHFNSVLGQLFSEPKMLYPFLHKCYDGVADILLEGEYLKSKGIVGEPDFYLRQGDTLFLFEHKDLTLGDQIKFSKDVKMMQQEILERVCYDGIDSKGEYKRKGGGQLLLTISEMQNNHTLDAFDPDIQKIKKICPIVVSTDTAFSALGVNAIAVQEFDNIRKKNNYKLGNVFVSNPIIIDFDTLIRLGYGLSTGKYDLWNIIWSYLLDNSFNLAPFSTYVIDKILRNQHVNEAENKFLFSELFEE